ncbi:MAG: hypothetical protein ABR526_11380 [Chthoniobacterales bacterium]
MKRLLLYVAAVAASILAAWGAVLLAFVNPSNWTNFQDYTSRDYVVVSVTNVAILILLLVVLFIIWRTVVRWSRAMRTSTI